MDISKNRIGGFPQTSVSNTLQLHQSFQNQGSAKEQSYCPIHPQNPIIAFNQTSGELVCKMCLYTQRGGSSLKMKIVPTAMITKTLKQSYDQTFNNYKQNLCDVSQDQNLQELFQDQYRKYFGPAGKRYLLGLEKSPSVSRKWRRRSKRTGDSSTPRSSERRITSIKR